MSIEATVELAAKLLKIPLEEARGCAFETDDPELTYYSVPTMGGDSLLVSDSGEVLYANSSVRYEKHMQAFIKGMRTPLEDFLLEAGSQDVSSVY